MGRAKLKIGQIVYFRPDRYNKNGRESKITKIGRKYFYVDATGGYNTRKVSIEEMRVYVDGYGWAESVYLSKQDIKNEDEYNETESCIRKQFDHFYQQKEKLTLHQLRRIWKIITGKE